MNKNSFMNKNSLMNRNSLMNKNSFLNKNSLTKRNSFTNKKSFMNRNSEIDMSMFGLMVEGVFVVIIGCIGVIGNTICIITFSRKLIQKNFHRLMLSLAAFDIIYILCSIFIFAGRQCIPRFRTYAIYLRLFPILLPLARMSIQGSIYHTIAIAVERYFIVCHPFYKVTSQWTAEYYIIPITIFAAIYNIPAFMELQVCTTEADDLTNSTILKQTMATNKSEDFAVGNSLNLTGGNMNITELYTPPQFNQENSSESELEGPTSYLCPTTLRLNPLYIHVYIMYLNMIINGIIPLLSLIILNTAVYRKLSVIRDCNDSSNRDALHSREVKLAQVSLIIVAVFIVCNGIKWIPNVWEFRQAGVKAENLYWPSWIKYIVHISHLLTVFNSSVNFFIYVCKQRSTNCFKAPKRRYSYNDGATSMTRTGTPRPSTALDSLLVSCDLEMSHSSHQAINPKSVTIDVVFDK